jgi:hypothetical protein
MNEAKHAFLKNELIFHLKHLAPDATGKWGVMNGQQMVEHFADMIRIASGKLQYPDAADEERMKKNYAFAMSDIPFKENTRNSLLPPEPAPVRNNTMQQAIEELQQELNYFFMVFEKTPGLRVKNPFFGNLDYAEQVQLLHKHAVHHLKQFGLVQ